MRNTTFKMNVKGTEYEVFNGTYSMAGVWVVNVETGYTMQIKADGTYANKAGVRNSLIKYLDKHIEAGLVEDYGKEGAMEEVEQELPEDLVDAFEAYSEAAEEGYFDDEEVEEQEVTEEEIVNTINDVIFRNLPKYVQKAIDYCDYVNGIYRIHVNTEFGNREIAADKWADASASVKNFCKTGEL